MDNVYSKSRILVAPTIWPEPFGRTIIEAGLNGVPSITSNLGGLPEAVGKGGILINNNYNIDQWVEAIYSLDDKLLYNDLAKNATLHAQKFNFENNYRFFINKIRDVIGINID